MNLCLGFAILGLCLPLPGQARSAIEGAGWRLLDSAQPNWSASSVFSAGTYRVSALVTGHGAVATSLFVLELSGDTPAMSPLKKHLDEVCKSDVSGRECSIGKLKFKTIECAGGWAMVAADVDLEKVALDCKRYEALFLDAKRSQPRLGLDGGQ